MKHLKLLNALLIDQKFRSNERDGTVRQVAILSAQQGVYQLILTSNTWGFNFPFQNLKENWDLPVRRLMARNNNKLIRILLGDSSDEIY